MRFILYKYKKKIFFYFYHSLYLFKSSISAHVAAKQQEKIYFLKKKIFISNTHLVSRSAPQAVRVELVGVEDVNSALDAQMMELTGDLQEQKVILEEDE